MARDEFVETLASPSPFVTAARHAAHFVPLMAIAVLALILGVVRARTGTSLPVRVLYGVVVAANVLVIAMSTWSALLGFGLAVASTLGKSVRDLEPVAPSGKARTAIVLPIHEEDAARVFAAIAVMVEDLAVTPAGAWDVFVLSDSCSAAKVAEEASMHALLARDEASGQRIFYRRRDGNIGRKAGNVADFVKRWGGAYEFMVILDADSLMTGAAIARLIGLMEANPRAGLIQAMCYPVGQTSFFAKLQQFDARLHGPLFQRGVAFWQERHGNFWGHNAILRIEAFAAHCGLPTLPGPPPFGGEILSHDTVEAALMLRGGWDVWMVPRDPEDGSWEETPTNAIDHFERDRRWCRGNLQHMGVLGADGLSWASLYHLVRGLLHYLYAPLVIAWIALYAAVDRTLAPDVLFALVVGLVVVPRLLSVALAFADSEIATGFGGRAPLVVGALADLVWAALSYPCTVAMHCAVLVGTMGGKDMRWDGRGRGNRGISWRVATRSLAVPSLSLMAFLCVLAPIAPLPLVLLGPGFFAAIPMAVLGSRRWPLADWCFRSPEEARSRPWRDALSRWEARLRARVATEPLPAPMGLPPDAELPMPVQVLAACPR